MFTKIYDCFRLLGSSSLRSNWGTLFVCVKNIDFQGMQSAFFLEQGWWVKLIWETQL